MFKKQMNVILFSEPQYINEITVSFIASLYNLARMISCEHKLPVISVTVWLNARLYNSTCIISCEHWKETCLYTVRTVSVKFTSENILMKFIHVLKLDFTYLLLVSFIFYIIIENLYFIHKPCKFQLVEIRFPPTCFHFALLNIPLKKQNHCVGWSVESNLLS